MEITDLKIGEDIDLLTIVTILSKTGSQMTFQGEPKEGVQTIIIRNNTKPGIYTFLLVKENKDIDKTIYRLVYSSNN